MAEHSKLPLNYWRDLIKGNFVVDSLHSSTRINATTDLVRAIMNKISPLGQHKKCGWGMHSLEKSVKASDKYKKTMTYNVFNICATETMSICDEIGIHFSKHQGN